MDIRELGFRSKIQLPSIPYIRYQVRLLSGVAAEEQAKELGKIARGLKNEHSREILAHTSSCSILSPVNLTKIDGAEIVKHQEIDLASDKYKRALLEVCNSSLIQTFRRAKSSPKIDFYKKRIYSTKEIFQMSLSSGRLPNDLGLDIIEGQRYLNFDFSIDENNFLILNFDFASEYHSQKTLDQLEIGDIKLGQKLVHTYDNASCEFSGTASHDISTPLPEISNNSIIQYHQQKGNLPEPLPEGFDVSAAAVQVKYAQKKGAKKFEASHAPQLLRKLYDRTQIDNDEFNAYLWPISKKFEAAVQTVRFLNENSKFRIAGLPMAFEIEPFRPNSLRRVNGGQHKNNLHFGNHVKGGQIKPLKVSYPSAALQKYYLLDKPSIPIRSVILFPDSCRDAATSYSSSLRNEFKKFGIEFKRSHQAYDPSSPISIRRICQELKDCDLVLGFVPEQDNYRENSEGDPYKVIKRQLVQRNIPSQMITQPMLRKGWNKHVGQNLILGINAKLGHTSWRIDSMPGQVDLFLGLDVSRKEGVTVGASSFVFNSDGQLLEWSATNFQAYQESFNSENLENLILDLYSRNPIKRLVIHRDGKLQPEEFRTLQKVESMLRQEGLVSLDAIEVLKSGFYRAAECHSSLAGATYTNPPRGWIWKHGSDEAVILTTGDREAKVSENSAPRPLRIRKRMGDMDLLTLAEQVYWLSEMQVGSTQTVRLPITTYYADRAAGFAQERLLPMGLQHEKRLWFL